MSRKTKLELTSGDESRHRRRIVDRLNWAVGLWNQLLDKLTIGGPTEPINFCDTLYVDCPNARVGAGESAPSCKLDVSDVLRIQGSTNPSYPTTGEGAVIAYDTTSAAAYKPESSQPVAIIQSYDQDANAWRSLWMRGKNLQIDANGSEAIKIATDGEVEIGDGTNVVIVENDGDMYFKGGAGLFFAEIYANDVDLEHTISGTGQANKVQITAFNANGQSNGATPDHTNDHITLNKTGKWVVAVSMTLESVAGAAAEFGYAVYKNNGATEFTNLHGHRDISGGGGAAGSVTLSGIIDGAENDTIEVWIWNESNTQNVKVDDINLSLFMIGG